MKESELDPGEVDERRCQLGKAEERLTGCQKTTASFQKQKDVFV